MQKGEKEERKRKMKEKVKWKQKLFFMSFEGTKRVLFLSRNGKGSCIPNHWLHSLFMLVQIFVRGGPRFSHRQQQLAHYISYIKFHKKFLLSYEKVLKSGKCQPINHFINRKFIPHSQFHSAFFSLTLYILLVIIKFLISFHPCWYSFRIHVHEDIFPYLQMYWELTIDK